MNEETNIHQILKVIYINTTIEKLEVVVKRLEKDKKRILDNIIQTEPKSSQNQMIQNLLNYTDDTIEETKCKQNDLDDKINKLSCMVKDIHDRSIASHQNSANSIDPFLLSTDSRSLFKQDFSWMHSASRANPLNQDLLTRRVWPKIRMLLAIVSRMHKEKVIDLEQRGKLKDLIIASDPRLHAVLNDYYIEGDKNNLYKAFVLLSNEK